MKTVRNSLFAALAACAILPQGALGMMGGGSQNRKVSIKNSISRPGLLYVHIGESGPVKSFRMKETFSVPTAGATIYAYKTNPDKAEKRYVFKKVNLIHFGGQGTITESLKLKEDGAHYKWKKSRPAGSGTSEHTEKGESTFSVHMQTYDTGSERWINQ